MLGFLLCYQLFGPHAFGFHLVSLLLNVAVVGMVLVWAEQLLRERVAALAAVALFALHPVHVEAVAWVSAVSDPEVTLFYLLTFWLFLRVATAAGGRRTWVLAAMTGSFILAILSKEQALTLPVLAVLYEHYYREDRLQTARLQKMFRYGPLWLVCLGYVLVRVRLMGAFAHSTRMHSIGVPDTLLSALALVGQYLEKLIWPAHLSAFYPFHPSARFLALPVLAGACALVAFRLSVLPALEAGAACIVWNTVAIPDPGSRSECPMDERLRVWRALPLSSLRRILSCGGLGARHTVAKHVKPAENLTDRLPWPPSAS